VLFCQLDNNDRGQHSVEQQHTNNFENLAVSGDRSFLPISWPKKKRLDIKPALLLFPWAKFISSQF
jgi:hypothetical protein